MKAIVLTCDKYRALTEHMILKYDEVWPGHPFQFIIPYQELRGEESERIKFVKTPQPIKPTVLELLSSLDDEEMVYWCLDDRYPIKILTDKVEAMLRDLEANPEMSGLLFCRAGHTLVSPDLALIPGEWKSSSGSTYLERKSWYQIWLHQFIRVKVIRNLFEQFPDEIPFALIMDKLKFQVQKPADHRLFVTVSNHAVFGESSSGGVITQNCYDSIIQTGIELPPHFQTTSGNHILMGELDEVQCEATVPKPPGGLKSFMHKLFRK